MRLVLMTSARQATTEVLPALGLLGHQVRVVAPELSSLLDGDSGDVVLVDARHDLIRSSAARAPHSSLPCRTQSLTT